MLGLMPARLARLRESSSARAGAYKRLARFCSESYREVCAPTNVSQVTIGGVVWTVPNSADTFAQKMLGGYLMRSVETAQIRPFVRGPVMLDIGANIGTTSIPRVVLGDVACSYAAEPEPANYAALVQTIRENYLEGFVLPDRVALGTEDGHGWLNVSHAIARHRLTTDPADLPVPVRTLDTWAASLGIDPLDVGFVKMDTQGHDGLILKGAPLLRQYRHIIWQMEFWPAAMAEAGQSYAEVCALIAASFTHVIDTGTSMAPFPSAETADRLVRLAGPGKSFSELLLLHLD